MNWFRTAPAIIAGLALCLGVSATEFGRADDKPATHTPPPDSAIPNDEFGAAIRLGKAIFDGTKANAGEFVGNSTRCANCHLDRLASFFMGTAAPAGACPLGA